MERRQYPLRDKKLAEKVKASYSSKTLRNQDAGMAALSTGEYNPYKGVSKDRMANQFWVSLELDPRSVQSVQERVIKPMQALAEEYEIPAIFAGVDDLPPHVSIDTGNFEEVTDAQRETAVDWLNSNTSHLRALSNILTGLTFNMDTIVVGPNSYICATHFNGEQGGVYRSRVLIEKAMAKALNRVARITEQEVNGEFKPPMDFKDLFHLSVSRIVKPVVPERLVPYARAIYDTIGQELPRNPLTVTVANVYRGLPVNYYLQHGPQLLNS